MQRNNQVTMLLTGVGIGAAVALLFARSSGKDLRRKLRRRADDAKDFLKERGESLLEKVETATETVQDKFAGKVADGKSAARVLSSKAKDLEHAAVAATNATGEMLEQARLLARKAGQALSH